MLKAFMASALILGSTLTMSVPVAAQTQESLSYGSTNTKSAPVTAQTQESIEAKSYQVAQRRRSAYVCTRDRNGYLRLRAWPSLRSRIIGRINNGQYLTILRSKDNWYKVNYQGQIGWVRGDYLCGGDQPTYITPSRYDGYVCTRDRYGYLNLRSGPSLRSRVIGRIPNGTRFTWYGSRDFDINSFVRFTHEGTSGWVNARYLCFY